MFTNRFKKNQADRSNRNGEVCATESRFALWVKCLAVFAAVALAVTLIFTMLLSRSSMEGSVSVHGDASSDSTENSTETNSRPTTENLVSGQILQPPYLEEPGEISVVEVLTLQKIAQLFERVPQRSWQNEGLATWGVANHIDIYKKILDYMEDRGLIDRSIPSYAGDYYNAEYPRISIEAVRECVDAAIGPFYRQYNEKNWYPAEGMPQDLPGSIMDEETLLLIEPETDCYVVINTPLYRHPDSSGDHFYARFVRMETEEGDLHVYVRFANYDVEKGQYSVYAERGGWWEGDKYHKVLLRGNHPNNYKSDAESVYNRLHGGLFDEYLPLYRVTFRADEAGEYWWYSSLKVEEGTEIPAELLQEPLPEGENSLGIKLPVCGEKDKEVPKIPEMSYLRDGYLWLTLNNRFYRYAPVPGEEEILTPTEKVYSFLQTEGETEVLYEIYTCVEYPDGFGLVFVNGADGTSRNYYQLN